MNLPATCSKPPRTQAGASRQWDAIIRRYRRAYAGGGMFGLDWRTMRANWPEGYEACQRLRELAPKLPG